MRDCSCPGPINLSREEPAPMSTIRTTTLRSLLAVFAAVVLMLGSVSSIFAQATPDASPSAEGAVPTLATRLLSVTAMAIQC